jgi:hypothetical protein
MARPSTHETLSRKTKIEGSSERAFGIVFAVAFALVGAWPTLSGVGPWYWAWAIGGAFLLVAMFVPSALKPLNFVWIRFGMVLGMVVSPLVLALVYYLAVTPTGLVMRLARRDLLRLQRERELKSYWIPRDPPGPAPDSIRNQF